MNKMIYRLLCVAVGVSLLSSCEKEDEVDTHTQETFTEFALLSNLLITNEGNNGLNNASISLISPDDGGVAQSVSNYVFQEKTGLSSLGDILQSAFVNDSLIFLVVSVDNEIIVFDKNTFEVVKTITGTGDGLPGKPRFITKVNDSKAYVSTWGSDGNGDEIKILDLNTLSITGTIKTEAAGPNEMVTTQGYVYVANSGGFGQSDTITIIDASTDVIHKQIRVWDYPSALAVDADGNVWVNCRGAYTDPSNGDYSVNNALVKIDASSKEPVDTVDLGVSFTYGIRLETNANSDKLYYLQSSDGVYEFDITDTEENDSPVVSGNFYGFGIAPTTGYLFCGLFNFSSSLSGSSVEVYTSSGGKISDFKTGIGPNGFYFF